MTAIANPRSKAHGKSRLARIRSLLPSERREDNSEDLGATAARATAFLTDSELRTIELTYAGGITAVQIVDVFTSRGIRFSEASFRKYVQQGLLPRSRRIGRKGKHRGSLGVYPAKSVRRINAVKQWMADGHTIEEISGQFLAFTDLVEGVSEAVTEVLGKLEPAVAAVRAEAERRVMGRELTDVKRLADDLTRRLDDLCQRVVAPSTNPTRRSGAAGGAEDLL